MDPTSTISTKAPRPRRDVRITTDVSEAEAKLLCEASLLSGIPRAVLLRTGALRHAQTIVSREPERENP